MFPAPDLFFVPIPVPHHQKIFVSFSIPLVRTKIKEHQKILLFLGELFPSSSYKKISEFKASDKLSL
jgi:hypothetical protein